MDGTVAVTNSGHGWVNWDVGENSVRHLLTVSDFVLSIVKVPNIKETVHAGQVEEAATGRGPAAVGEIALMVAGLHNGSLEIFIPDLGWPITNGKEELKMGGVTLESVNRSVMLTLFETKAHVDFNLILLLGGLHKGTLFGTNKVLKRRGIGVVFKRGTAKNFGSRLVGEVGGLEEDEFLSGSLRELALIPPEESTIGRGGHTLSCRLTEGKPVDVINGVVMGLLEESCSDGLNHARGFTLSHIEELEGTIVSTANEDIVVLVVESHSAQRWSGVEGLLGFVGVIQVPDVGLLGHVGRHLLEAQLGIGSTDALVRAAVRVPADLSNSALNLVRILEDHNCLSRDSISGVLGLLAFEILFEEIDLVVLHDAAAGSVS
jgi:hypothetical protein